MVNEHFAEHKKQLEGAKATTMALSASALTQTTPTFRLICPYQGDDPNRLTDNEKNKLKVAERC